MSGRPSSSLPPVVIRGIGPCICGHVPPPGTWHDTHPCWVTPDDVVRIVRAKNSIVPHTFTPGNGAKGCKWCEKEQGAPVHG